MKNVNVIYKNITHLKKFIERNVSLDKKVLVKMHTSNLLKENISALVKKIRDILPESEIFGSSADAVICNGGICEDATLITFLEFDNADIDIKMIPLFNKEQRNLNDIYKDIFDFFGNFNDSFSFIFYPSKFHNPSELIQNISKHTKNSCFIGGGCASSTANEEKNPAFVFFNDVISRDCVVIARIKGEGLLYTENAIAGLETIGKTYTVTGAEGHMLYSVDDCPAKKWFEYLIGEDHLKSDENICHLFPLTRLDKWNVALNTIYSANPLTKEPLKDGLFVFDELKVGERIRIGYISPEKSGKKVVALCYKILSSPVEVLFAYSCMTRQNILKNCAKWELSPFINTNVSGAFLAGEIIQLNGENIYANSAFCVAGLSENPQARINLNMSRIQDSSDLQIDNYKLVNYFFSTVNSELVNEVSQHKISNDLTIDEATGYPNLSRFVFDCKSNNYDKVCLISLKNEDIIRVFVKDSIWIEYLEIILSVTKNAIKDMDIQIYIYNNLSILVAAAEELLLGSFEKLIKEIREDLFKERYPAYLPVFEFSIACSKDKLLQKVELARLKLQKVKSQFYVYNEDDEDINTYSEEMRVLEIINDGLKNNGVIPYYQGIHNNTTGEIELFEALMRIVDSDNIVHQPGEFLAIAKEYKLYDRLSKRMINSVFEQFERFDKSVSINLDIQDIYNPEIVSLIFENLQKSTHPHKYIFELVESEDILDYDYLNEFSRKIHEYGGKIAIDDFGSGYSNFVHLLRLNVDYLKISGDIIEEICEDSACQEFVKMITEWCNTRKKHVVAEFVKNEQIQEKIKEYKVSHSQGYYFSKPDILQ